MEKGVKTKIWNTGIVQQMNIIVYPLNQKMKRLSQTDK